MKLLDAPVAAQRGLKPIPGDPGIPVINRNLDVFRGSWLTDLRYYERFGEVNWSRALGRNLISVDGPDAVERLLINRDKAFASGPGWSFFIGPFFERGLMLLDFEEHHENRHIMQAAFTRPRLEGYLAAMTPTITKAVASWGDSSGPTPFYPQVKDLGLTIATTTFMGEQPGAQGERVMEDFQACVQAGTSIVRANVPGTRWAKGLASRHRLEEYLYPRIAEARRAEVRDDLLSVLCHIEGDNGERFSDQDVVNHMIFLIMAAHDTSTGTLATMAYFMAKHPDWQERCRAEAQALGKDAIEYADIEKLPSLELVMKESLRLVSPVPVVVRSAVKDTEILGHHVPAGTLVGVALQHLHLLPTLWTNPTTFDPERFGPERREDAQHRFAFVPFGGGVHKCIGLYFGGMEVKSVMHQMLLNYSWSVPANYEMKLNYKSLPFPQDGLPLTLRRL